MGLEKFRNGSLVRGEGCLCWKERWWKYRRWFQKDSN